MTFKPSDLSPHAVRLTRLYILALSAVACLSILGQLLVQWSLDRQLSDSTVINLAGRQRMLSQRLTKAALAFQRASSLEELAKRSAEMNLAILELRRADDGLRQGNKLLGLPGRNSAEIQQMLARIQPHFVAIQDATGKLLSGNSDSAAAIDQLLAHEPKFLAHMDEIVAQYELEARQRVSWLKRIETSLLLLTLLVLTCEGLLIFRPAIRRLRLATTAVEESRQQLETAKQLADSANEAKSQFLGTISHELRNPLQAIVGSVDLASQATDSDERQEHLAVISTAARTLLALFNDLLDLARIEAGQLSIVSSPFDAVRLTERTLAMVRSQADARGLELDWHCSAAPSRGLSGDEIRIQQVLLNLLTNALKFTSNGTVSVRLSPLCENSEVATLRWEVRDTGIGIPDSHQTAIFDRFTQVPGVLTPQGGAGLGLAICKRLVTLMQGEIGVDSKLGVGSTFWFELPLAKSFPAQPAACDPYESAAIPQSRHVLLVDDDPVNRTLLSQLVESLGHAVVTASNGEDAITKYRERPFDVAILDWQMPGMNGGELAAKLRSMPHESNRPPTSIIALSASLERKQAQDANRSSFDRWLTKPVSLAELAILLGTVEEKPDCRETPDSRWSQPLHRLGGRSELLSQLAQSWSANLPDLLHQLQSAAHQKNTRELARLAHLISGQASIFAAHELASLAKSLERQATAPNLDPSLLTTLEAHCQKLNAELQPWLANNCFPVP
jgi:signal transduction histidine kinase/CheY-like chemotaxis protein